MKGIIKFLVIAVMFTLFAVACNIAGYRKKCEIHTLCL